jgi:hypothetical protein
MIKKIIVSSLLSLLAGTAAATPFDGFYVGADVGLSQASFKKTQVVHLNFGIENNPVIDIPIQNNKKLTDTSFLGNFDIGFSKVFKDLL